MKSMVLKAALIGFVAALAAAAAQVLVTGEQNPAITGGVAGAVAAAVTVTTSNRSAPDD